MTRTEATMSAIASLLDVVEDLCQGLAAGQTPERDWAEIVADTFREHRADMREAE